MPAADKYSGVNRKFSEKKSTRPSPGGSGIRTGANSFGWRRQVLLRFEASRGERCTQARQYRELVYFGSGEAVKVENVVPVVQVGSRGLNFEFGVLGLKLRAKHQIPVEVRQAALVDARVVDHQLSVLLQDIGFPIRCSIRLLVALGLGEGKGVNRSSTHSSSRLCLFLEGVGTDQVEVVATIETGPIGPYAVIPFT